jgi:hypothetical protein
MQWDPAQREMTLKVVYDGPALSGKTTNLQMLHQLLAPATRGRLMSLDTADDRTLFFDLLPIFFRIGNDIRIKIKIYTVPGQVMHRTTRRIVLAGADGIAFVADSQLSETRANTEAWTAMLDNLRSAGLDPSATPIVLQFNKRDMPAIRSDAELSELRLRSSQPIVAAVAIRGEGVLETLFTLLRHAFRHLAQQPVFSAHCTLSEDEFVAGIAERVVPDRAASLVREGPEPLVDGGGAR